MTLSTVPVVGLVVEGQTEYAALPGLLARLGLRTTAPSVFHGQPAAASPKSLVEGRLLKPVRVQLAKDARRVIVVLDREARAESAKEFAERLCRELRRQVKRSEGAVAARRVWVAVADRCFENWLLADPQGVSKSTLLAKNANLVGKVACHADDRDAVALLRSALTRGWYEKAIHGPRLAQHIRVADPRARWCSRSFEAFLRLVLPLVGEMNG